MAKSTVWKNDLMLLLFNNINSALIGDATGLRASSAAGSLYVSLHTADPSNGNQSSSETNYTGYLRVAVVRTSGGWTVAGNQAQNAAVINFAAATAGTSTITHFGIGTDPSGAGKLLHSGTLTPNISVSTGIAPLIPINGLTITES